MWITVGDAMRLDALQGVEVIAGAKGLSRMLNSVTVLDAPDAVTWLKGHELVLTSTFPLMRCQLELNRMVDDMAARQVAALGIKLNRFMTELPPAMLQRADEVRLPILSLPDEIAWIDIINPIFAEVMALNGALLQHAEPIRNSFNDLLLSGATLHEFVAALSRLVQKPVIVHSHVAQLKLASSDLNENVVTSALAALSQAPMRRTKPLTDKHDIFELEHSLGRLICCRLDPSVDANGRLVLLDQQKNLTQSDLWCLRHARDAISIKLLQSRAESSIAREVQNEFVQSLLDSGVSDTAHRKLLQRGRERGYRLYERYLVVALKFPRLKESALRNLSDFFYQKLGSEDILVGWIGNARFVLLVPERPETNFSADGGAAYMKSLLQDIGHQGGVAHWHAGLSQILPSSRMARGLEQAEYALRHSIQSGHSCELKLHDDTSLHRIFSHSAIQNEIYSYVQEWLEPLLQHDQRHQSRLIDTMRVFIENSGNYRETARLLHVHPNTVRYRIEQAERLTRRSIQQPKLRFQYQLAMYLLPTLDKE